MKKLILVPIIGVLCTGYLQAGGSSTEATGPSDPTVSPTGYSETGMTADPSAKINKEKTIEGEIVSLSEFLGASQASHKGESLTESSESDSDDAAEGRSEERGQARRSESEPIQYVLVSKDDGILGIGESVQAYLLLKDNASPTGKAAFAKIDSIARNPVASSMGTSMSDPDRQNVRGAAEDESESMSTEAESTVGATENTVKVTGKVLSKGDLRAILVADVEPAQPSEE